MSGTGSGAGTGTRARQGRPATKAVTWLVAMAIVLFCAYAANSYRQVSTDEPLEFAKTRDVVLDAGERHIARLNTMDAAQVDEELREWLEATDGSLREELERTRENSTEVLQEVGTTTTGTVTDAAVIQLDTRAGTARVIATVRVDSTPRTGEPTTDRKRFEAALGRTGDGWKLTSLTAITTGA